MERRIRFAVCWLAWLSVSVGTGAAQEVIINRKNAEIVSENTYAALTPESLYRIENDTVRDNTLSILTSVTLRNTMYSMDMQARLNMNGFRKESRTYERLVWEIHYFIESAAQLIREASKNPHHAVFVTRQTAKLVLEAKNFVRYAVVVAMNGKVPNPFKISVDSLDRDLSTVPDYIYDEDRDSLATDGLNLLLPDDSMAIMNETRRRLAKIRRAMDMMYWKLKTDFNVRNLIWTASRIDGRLYDRNVYVIEELKSNMERAGGLW